MIKVPSVENSDKPFACTCTLIICILLANPPVSILQDEDFTVKIADFGASELISSGKADIAKKNTGELWLPG